MAAIPAVPTLGATPFLTHPPDIMGHYIRQYAAQPKSMSDTFYSEIISLSLVLAQNGHDRSRVVSPITQDLTKVLSAHFAGGNVVVDVTTQETSAASYVIYITASVTINGVSYTVDPQITVQDGKIVLSTDTPN
jgi:hypothetical protein